MYESTTALDNLTMVVSRRTLPRQFVWGEKRGNSRNRGEHNRGWKREGHQGGNGGNEGEDEEDEEGNAAKSSDVVAVEAGSAVLMQSILVTRLDLRCVFEPVKD